MDGSSMGRARTRLADERGFSLVEAIVALLVLATVMTALTYAMIGSLTASRASRIEQQAIDFATQRLEQVREMDFSRIGNDEADVAGDASWVRTCGDGNLCIDPGEGTFEPLVLEGAITPHSVPVDAALANNTSFTVRTFVTDPGDAYEAGYRRVTVVVTWKSGAVERQRTLSSFVAATTRGLPLPMFKLTPVGSTTETVNPAADIVFGFELTNQGAPDTWNITASGSTGWVFYRDDGDGSLTLTTDPLLTDTTADGAVDTARVPPTSTVLIWAVRPGVNNTVEGTLQTRFTAVSAMSPEASSGTAYLDTAATITSAVITATPTPTPSAGPTDPQALAAPTGVTATASGMSAIVSWTAVDGATSYEIYRDGIPVGSSASTTWTSPTWPAGTYVLQVRAIKANKASVLSSAVTVALAAPPVLTSSAATQGAPLTMAVDGPQVTFDPVPTPAVPDCESVVPVAVPTPASGYTAREYALHNRSGSNSAWAGVVTTVSTLPQYSTDLAEVGGRVVQWGGSFTAGTAKLVDWRANVDRREYNGTAVLSLWVAPLPAQALTDVGLLRAQLYTWKGASATPLGSATAPSSPVFSCAGEWQKVQWALPVSMTKALQNNEYIGVRVWNEGGQDVRLAYDVAPSYRASLTLPER